MKLLLLPLGALALGGCATQWLEAAQNDCTAKGLTEEDPMYAECVDRGYQRRAESLARFQDGLARAAAIHNAGMPGAAPATMPPATSIHPRPMRFYRGERVDGMNRLCFYDTINGTEIVTIGAVELCPIS